MYNLCFKQNINFIAKQFDRILENFLTTPVFIITKYICDEHDFLSDYLEEKKKITFRVQNKEYRYLPDFFSKKTCSQIELKIQTATKDMDVIECRGEEFRDDTKIRTKLYGINKFIALEYIRYQHEAAKIMAEMIAKREKCDKDELFIFNTDLMTDNDYDLEEAWEDYERSKTFEYLVGEENDGEKMQAAARKKLNKTRKKSVFGFSLESTAAQPQPLAEGQVRLSIFYGKELGLTPRGTLQASTRVVFDRPFSFYIGHPKKFAQELNHVWKSATGDIVP